MTGLVLALVIGGAAVLALFAMGTRGALLKLATAALALGAAGYAVQGKPGTAGSPRSAVRTAPPIPLTNIRRAFFGRFTSSEHWLVIAESYARRGSTREAVGVLQAAVREHPGDASLWVGLGNALVDHAGRLTPASQLAYQRAAELAPGHPAAPFFLGLALARSGNPTAGVALWREVLASAPADASWRPMVEDAIAALDGRATSPVQSPPEAGR